MRYARAFFDLQIELAQAASALSRLPLAETLLRYTNIYVRLGLGRDFEPRHPGWQQYLAGLREGRDPREWTYHVYLERAADAGAPIVVAAFGCFAYARLSGDRIRLHFRSAETPGRSPLAVERRDQRLAELAALVAHARAAVPSPLRVVGASWLYNLEAYRRLFPPSYLATARVIHDRFQHMPLWGQFVNRHGEVREDMAETFRQRLARQTSVDGLGDCFPFQVLALEAPLLELAKFYGE